MLERWKEPIAAGQKMADEHLPLDVVKYEIEHLAVTRNNNADEPSPEHGSRAEEREMSGKPILTVDKNYICSKNGIYTNEQLQILKSLEKSPQENHSTRILFKFHHKWSRHTNRATHLI